MTSVWFLLLHRWYTAGLTSRRLELERRSAVHQVRVRARFWFASRYFNSINLQSFNVLNAKQHSKLAHYCVLTNLKRFAESKTLRFQEISCVCYDNHSYGGPQLSHQKQIAHIKNKLLTSKTNCSHQKQIAHIKFKLLTSKTNCSHQIQIAHIKIKKKTKSLLTGQRLS